MYLRNHLYLVFLIITLLTSSLRGRSNILSAVRSRFYLHSSLKISYLVDNNHYIDIINVCKNVVGGSYYKFSSGSEYYANPKPQMGSWLDQGLEETLLSTLNFTSINDSSNFVNFLTHSPTSIVSNVNISAINNNDFELRLLYVPKETSLSISNYAPGTVIYYKALKGSCILSTDINGRVIQSDPLSNDVNYSNKKSHNLLRRLGGPCRVLKSTTSNIVNGKVTHDCLILELVLHPPGPSDESYDGGIGTADCKFITIL